MSSQSVRITQGQGNFLLMSAAGFVLPDKLGEASYSIADRSIAEEEVGLLYRELKSRSPLMQKRGKDRAIVFGPVENLYEASDGGRTWWEIKDLDAEVEISINDDIRNGIFWCILVSIHPGSQRRIGAAAQVETAWPLAKRLGIEGEIRKDIGLDKACHRRLNLDAEAGKEKREVEA